VVLPAIALLTGVQIQKNDKSQFHPFYVSILAKITYLAQVT